MLRWGLGHISSHRLCADITLYTSDVALTSGMQVGDRLKAQCAGLEKYKASAISGFFLLHDNVEGKPVYPDEMASIFALANSTHGVNKDCIADKAPKDQWQCNFAQEAYAYTKSPTFPLNSALDSWQTG